MQLGMPRALMKKISCSKDSNRTDILRCLRDLSSDGSEPDIIHHLTGSTWLIVMASCA